MILSKYERNNIYLNRFINIIVKHVHLLLKISICVFLFVIQFKYIL